MKKKSSKVDPETTQKNEAFIKNIFSAQNLIGEQMLSGRAQVKEEGDRKIITFKSTTGVRIVMNMPKNNPIEPENRVCVSVKFENDNYRLNATLHIFRACLEKSIIDVEMKFVESIEQGEVEVQEDEPVDEPLD